MKARSAGYQRVATDEPPGTSNVGSSGRESWYHKYKAEDEQYDILITKPPKGAIALALLLMVLGMTCLVLAWLHFTQQLLGKEQAEIGFTVLGLLTLVPGAYHTRLAYYAWKRVPGYTWDMIPTL